MTPFEKLRRLNELMYLPKADRREPPPYTLTVLPQEAPPAPNFCRQGPLGFYPPALQGDDLYYRARRFEYPKGEHPIYLVGDFNGWQAHCHLVEEDGILVDVSDTPGFYRFEINGEMRLDPSDDLVICNAHGLVNKIRPTPDLSLQICNMGTEPLHLRLRGDCPWFAPRQIELTLSPGAQQQLDIAILENQAEPGTQKGILHITHPDGEAEIPIRQTWRMPGPMPTVLRTKIRVEDLHTATLPIPLAGTGRLHLQLAPNPYFELHQTHIDHTEEDPAVRSLPLTRRQGAPLFRRTTLYLALPDCYLASHRLMTFDVHLEGPSPTVVPEIILTRSLATTARATGLTLSGLEQGVAVSATLSDTLQAAGVGIVPTPGAGHRFQLTIPPGITTTGWVFLETPSTQIKVACIIDPPA